MVNLLTGPKGSGKTQQMIERARATEIHTAYLSTSERSAWMTMM